MHPHSIFGCEVEQEEAPRPQRQQNVTRRHTLSAVVYIGAHQYLTRHISVRRCNSSAYRRHLQLRVGVAFGCAGLCSSRLTPLPPTHAVRAVSSRYAIPPVSRQRRVSPAPCSSPRTPRSFFRRFRFPSQGEICARFRFTNGKRQYFQLY